MKDSTSAASAGAELVLRGFPGVVLVRRRLLPPPETLPNRWLQAAEEAEVESRPFRSLPREEDGTGAAGTRRGLGTKGRGGPGDQLARVCEGIVVPAARGGHRSPSSGDGNGDERQGPPRSP